jgi:Ca-activated chloride channel family protein
MAKPLDHLVGVVILRLLPLGALLVSLASGTAFAQGSPQPGGAAQKGAGTPQAPIATFRSAVEVVTVSVSVKTRGGKVVRDLERADFEVLDSAVPVALKDFYAGESPISLAVLLDISGSMAVGGNINRAREAVTMAAMNLRNGSDEVALFTFDSDLREVIDFTTELNIFDRLNLTGTPWGITSLYDAIGASARRVAERSNKHRALLVITDGVDTGSRLTAAEVSGIASSIDVPVYLLTVVSPLDHPDGEHEARPTEEKRVQQTSLVDLARWTGGDTYFASVPSHTSVALQSILAELRHQYLLTFEPGARRGWHPLEVRVKKRNLIVRARGGYLAGSRAGS